MALHTAGSLLEWNPHLRALALSGAALDNGHFVELREIDVELRKQSCRPLAQFPESIRQVSRASNIVNKTAMILLGTPTQRTTSLYGPSAKMLQTEKRLHGVKPRCRRTAVVKNKSIEARTQKM